MASTYPTSLDAFTNPTATSLLTSPSHAQQHSDINDAMEAVQTKLAIGNTVIGTYTSYTPTFAGSIVIGNGTITSSYCRVNNFVHWWGKIVIGSTTTFSGTTVLTYPISMDTNQNAVGASIGTNTFYDTSVGTWYAGIASGNANPLVWYPSPYETNGTYLRWAAMNSSSPMTWATGDVLSWNLYYKAA